MSAREASAIAPLAVSSPAAPTPPRTQPLSGGRAALLDAQRAAIHALRTAERARMWWLGEDEETPLNSQGRIDTPLQ